MTYFSALDLESDIDSAKAMLETCLESLEDNGEIIDKGLAVMDKIEDFSIYDADDLGAVLDMVLQILTILFPDTEWDDFDRIEQAEVTMQTLREKGFVGFDLYG